MEAIWRSLKLYELVVEGRKPEPDSSAEEKEAYESLFHFAVGLDDGAAIVASVRDLEMFRSDN
jgi:hypothetical protein